METIHTADALRLAELQKKDAVIAGLKARLSAVPRELEKLNSDLEKKKASMGAAREALLTLQKKKKDRELAIAEAEEGVRKHQFELNQVKNNDAFKALLGEIETCKAAKDALETEVLLLLDELDKAAEADRAAQAGMRRAEEARDAEAAVLEASGRGLAAELAAAEAERAAQAGAIDRALLEKYETVRDSRAGAAVVPVHEDPATGKLSCGGCHMALTPQKTLDVKKPDTFAVCPECRRFMYLERTIYG